MRLLLVNNLYPPFAIGGYERAAARNAEALAAAGLDVFVLTWGDASCYRPEDDAVRVARCLRLLPPAYYRFPADPRAEAWNAARLSEAVAYHRPDLVWFWNTTRLGDEIFGVPRRAGVASALFISDLRLAADPTTPRDLPVAFPSRELLWAASPYGYSPARSVVLPHWIDPPDETASHEGHEILCVGGLYPWKGIDDVLEAVAGLSLPYRLTLIGAGPAGPIRVQATRLGVRSIAGPFVAHDTTPWYRRAAVVVYPTRLFEAQALVPLEALAWGLPVITTRLGGNALYFDPEPLAYEVPPNDPAALREGIAYFLSDRTQRRTWGARGREAVLRFFSRQAILPRTLAWLEEAARSAPASIKRA